MEVVVVLINGEVITSSYFPEPVEIKKFEPYENYYFLEAVGKETNQYYELLVEKDKLEYFQKINKEHVLNVEDIQKYIQYVLLQNELKYSESRALGNKQILPLPHQIEAVYSRMLQSPHVRFLLADDPGAGKTIMSGMLIKELLLRMDVDRVLILVPPLVLKQWQTELSEKFSLDFQIINRQTLNEYGNKNPFVEKKLILASMYWAAREDVQPLIKEAQFDLIIVDEAHKMAAYSYGTKKKKVHRTKLYQLGEAILHKARHALLLTATPHKGDSENFRLLLKLLDEDVFASSSLNESLKEKANPFMIRRLKENMINFDGTPIFPKRTSITVGFDLTEGELELYESVTQYVKEYFNKAMDKGSQSTAFAMMLLQKRLSSSIEAIYLSLKRRYARLVKLYKQTEKERQKFLRQIKRLEVNHIEEESLEEQEKIEKQLEQSVADLDLKELKREILVLQGLIKKAEHIRLYTVEKKYQELEETLFGLDGILKKNEKIIIFTEFVDTLNYLEEKLLKRVPKVAKIIGSLSMEERRKQVELFRNECQIMLATDAGGESINLQFCNQMINFDIPWNPNRLEQRMGRIHRIGQKNEVFVFNLVAKNTREGHVLIRLLNKMEQMQEDLGSDAVYNFVGDVLEDEYDSLADLMQQAIMERENLDDLIDKMDQTLTDEHQKLIQIVKEESMQGEEIDLSSLRRKKNSIVLERIPVRAYADFTNYILQKRRVRVSKSQNNRVMRIESLPRFIREELPEQEEKNSLGRYRYTNSVKMENEETPLFTENHPLFPVALSLMKNEFEGQNWEHYVVSARIPEQLYVEIYAITIIDGTGKILENRYIHMAKRENGEVIELDHNWIFLNEFGHGQFEVKKKKESQLFNHVVEQAVQLRDDVSRKRTKQLNKLQSFIEKSFSQQYRETFEKLKTYQEENIDNRNSALINQMNAKLNDLDMKRQNRILGIEREKNIAMIPPKKVISLDVLPQGKTKRVLASDYYEAVLEYEKANGRLNVKQHQNLGLVDFSSERFNGEERFIILVNDLNATFSDEELEDLEDIKDKVYVYLVEQKNIKTEVKLSSVN